jgi:hypothetical protein
MLEVMEIPVLREALMAVSNEGSFFKYEGEKMRMQQA